MVVTRFAPSPTGSLHIGGLRTALYNYLWAKKNNGKFILRVEDTDFKRNKKKAVKGILEAFDWTDLGYDELFFQSERLDIYKAHIQQLLDAKKAYYCYACKEELNELRASQEANKQRTQYDRRYRNFKGAIGAIPKGVTPTVRIKAPLDGQIVIQDGIKGEVKFNIKDSLDDFIIARSDGTPTYNFVVAIDDALMGITDVIRGDDHLSNTPKQVVVYEALGFKMPRFYHIPMILDEQGHKLSKRDGVADVMEYKKMGYLNSALINFLARLGWSYENQEIFSKEELLKLFDPNDINASASSYTLQKLNWINKEHLRSSDSVTLLRLCGLEPLKQNVAILRLILSRCETLVQVKKMLEKIIKAPHTYDEKALKKFGKPENIKYLKLFREKLLTLQNNGEALLESFVKEHDIGFANIAQPVRIALVGDSNSASIGTILDILGQEQSISRIDKFLQEH